MVELIQGELKVNFCELEFYNKHISSADGSLEL